MLEVQEKDLDRITEVLHNLLKGTVSAPIELPASYPNDELRQVVEYVNRFIGEYQSFAIAMSAMSRGELDFVPPSGKMSVLQSFKNLHANLRHLTWKTEQIAGGDFTQTVDFMGHFSEAFNSMTGQLRAAFTKIEQQNQELSQANAVIRIEKEKSDKLLLNILPMRVAEDLKHTGGTQPELFENVTVLFSDFVGFTKVCSTLSPQALIDELNDIFTQFDTLAQENCCERIKTIGDAYLAVCGMPEPSLSHAENILRLAWRMVCYLKRRNAASPLQWQVRIGVHTGPVVGAVVGIKKYIYDVFGDTINGASRMESNSEPMSINVSEAAYALTKDVFTFFARQPLEVKGRGMTQMYFLEGGPDG